MSQEISRFGLRYFNDEDHYTQADLAAWVPRLSDLGITWLTLTASERRAIPESFISGIIQSGIQPIIHIPAKIGTLSLREIAPILKSYADWGVHQVVIYDKPNMQSAWNAADWTRGELVERFLDVLLPILHVQMEIGLQPLIPPLEPGGDYWDTVFLETLMAGLVRRGQHTILNNLGVALYCWTYGRSLEWGMGGPEAWPEAKPYQCQEGSENHIGFRIYEWYQAIIEGMTGRSAPLYTIAGGYRPGLQTRQEDALDVSRKIYSLFTDKKLPRYLTCFNFDAFQDQSLSDGLWFNHDRSDGKMAIAITQLKRDKRKIEYSNVPKTIEHYALLPSSGTGHATDRWERLAKFAFAVRPTFGFSVDEASHARKVTILAGQKDVSEEVHQRLEDSGCKVSRIDIYKDPKLLEAITAFASNDNKAGGRDE